MFFFLALPQISYAITPEEYFTQREEGNCFSDPASCNCLFVLKPEGSNSLDEIYEVKGGNKNNLMGSVVTELSPYSKIEFSVFVAVDDSRKKDDCFYVEHSYFDRAKVASDRLDCLAGAFTGPLKNLPKKCDLNSFMNGLEDQFRVGFTPIDDFFGWFETAFDIVGATNKDWNEVQRSRSDDNKCDNWHTYKSNGDDRAYFYGENWHSYHSVEDRLISLSVIGNVGSGSDEYYCGILTHSGEGEGAIGAPEEYDICKSNLGKGSDYSKQCTDCYRGVTLGNNQRGMWTSVGCISIENAGTDIIKFLISLGIGIAGGIALLSFLYAAFLLSVSQGEPQKVSKAKEIMTAAIVGLLFIIFSVTILQFIGADILKIPGFGE